MTPPAVKFGQQQAHAEANLALCCEKWCLSTIDGIHSNSPLSLVVCIVNGTIISAQWSSYGNAEQLIQAKMNGTQEAPAGAPLAAHFEAKRRIMATVKQMEARGEKLEEATPEEILEAASKAAETVFKFDFSLADEPEASAKTRSRNRKRSKKRRAKKAGEQVAEAAAGARDEEKSADGDARPADAEADAAARRGNGNGPQKKQQRAATKSTPVRAATGASSSFLKLRKATGTESEVAKMHLRYGQGRRNLAATRQRELRKQAADDAPAASGDFKFNFAAS
ncbi:unnamed protein product [Phytophthora fragariaefolia]|uniref:Unnamed protein product n=1 Tax=Phytophthora fragariaefolia TaxID=1490495 RepID=A0A9W6XYB0_9STRA|nr:unnamed protein product [Phytophthora fragariaefolia]